MEKPTISQLSLITLSLIKKLSANSYTTDDIVLEAWRYFFQSLLAPKMSSSKYKFSIISECIRISPLYLKEISKILLWKGTLQMKFKTTHYILKLLAPCIDHGLLATQYHINSLPWNMFFLLIPALRGLVLTVRNVNGPFVQEREYLVYVQRYYKVRYSKSF